MLILFILSALAALYLSLSLLSMLSILFNIIAMQTENIPEREFKAEALLRNINYTLFLLCAFFAVIFASHYFYNNI